jgi:hypothetical protein
MSDPERKISDPDITIERNKVEVKKFYEGEKKYFRQKFSLTLVFLEHHPKTGTTSAIPIEPFIEIIAFDHLEGLEAPHLYLSYDLLVAKLSEQPVDPILDKKSSRPTLETEISGLKSARPLFEKESSGLKSARPSFEEEISGFKPSRPSLEKETSGLKSARRHSFEKETSGFKLSLEKEPSITDGKRPLLLTDVSKREVNRRDQLTRAQSSRLILKSGSLHLQDLMIKFIFHRIIVSNNKIPDASGFTVELTKVCYLNI